MAHANGRVLAWGEYGTLVARKVDGIAHIQAGVNVRVGRGPLAGRVLAIERGGRRFRAAFNRKAETENVRCAMVLESAAGVRFEVVQITGWIARRIVCHPQVGEWVERGARYGLIRFGSRTDVLLPATSVAKVKPRDRVRGGRTILAELEAPGGQV